MKRISFILIFSLFLPGICKAGMDFTRWRLQLDFTGVGDEYAFQVEDNKRVVYLRWLDGWVKFPNNILAAAFYTDKGFVYMQEYDIFHYGTVWCFCDTELGIGTGMSRNIQLLPPAILPWPIEMVLMESDFVVDDEDKIYRREFQSKIFFQRGSDE